MSAPISPSRTFTVQYAYDAASNRVTLTDPESGATHYTYDTLNRLTGLNDFQSHNFTFSYDALSRRTQLTRPNGVNTNYSYDNVSHLLSVLHQVGSTTVDGASYTYDSAGNRTAKTDQASSVTSNYGYDAIYQLTGVSQGSTTTESYTYDTVGNRLSSLGVSPYAYNSSNQLTSTPSTTYTYDSNGSTLTKVDSSGTTTYNWDYVNQLSSVVLPASDGTVSFKYDPFGRRIQKSAPSGTVNYLYEGPNLIEEVDNSGTVLARYTQGTNVDEPLTELRSGTTSYYEQDGINAVTSLSNSAGALANTYTFDSYGKLTASTGTITNPFQYTGRESDAETGAYYFRARYYDQNGGRFLNEDPLGFQGGDRNFYSYVFNSPTNAVDPSGMKANAPGQPCCAKPPTGPTRVPWADINKEIHRAMETAASENPSFSVPWFVMMVDKGGAWDYNSFYSDHSVSDPFGNYAFGAYCNAMGYSAWQCQGGGGLAQYAQDLRNGFSGRGWQRSGQGMWPFIWPYGDRRKDSELIRRGWEYAEWKRRCSTQ